MRRLAAVLALIALAACTNPVAVYDDHTTGPGDYTSTSGSHTTGPGD